MSPVKMCDDEKANEINQIREIAKMYNPKALGFELEHNKCNPYARVTGIPTIRKGAAKIGEEQIATQ
jgi:hypothetical protein